ncbi:hypothetical protein SRHO_G00303740 [Serrasalmus rhombeus]
MIPMISPPTGHTCIPTEPAKQNCLRETTLIFTTIKAVLKAASIQLQTISPQSGFRKCPGPKGAGGPAEARVGILHTISRKDKLICTDLKLRQ